MKHFGVIKFVNLFLHPLPCDGEEELQVATNFDSWKTFILLANIDISSLCLWILERVRDVQRKPKLCGGRDFVHPGLVEGDGEACLSWIRDRHVSEGFTGHKQVIFNYLHLLIWIWWTEDPENTGAVDDQEKPKEKYWNTEDKSEENAGERKETTEQNLGDDLNNPEENDGDVQDKDLKPENEATENKWSND